MTTLTLPSFNRRVLQTVGEQAATEPVRTWPRRTLQTALGVLQGIRASAFDMRRELENELASGVEPRWFVRTYSEVLPMADEHVAAIRDLIDSLVAGEDLSSQSLVAELRLHEHEAQAFRDLLAEALAQASDPPHPVDWDRVDAAGEAFASGKTKPFSRR
jgi:hypothetical protein